MHRFSAPHFLPAASLKVKILPVPPLRSGSRCWVVWAGRRWCSSFSSHAGTPPSPPAPVASTATGVSLEEQLRSLSPEDQTLIRTALSTPAAASSPSAGMGGPGIGPAHGEMVAAFTCGRCDHRTVKRFSKHAYTKGVVLVECPNCRVKHLLADHLGWWEDNGVTIEDILRERGEHFVHLGGGDYQAVVAEDEKEK